MTENIKEEIKDKVIDCINLSVAGRLIIFKPDKKGLEDYLVIERRGKYKEDKIYFQVNSLLLPAKSVNFTKDFSQAEFKTGKNFYLLFAYFNEVSQKIDDYIWVVPSVQFVDIADVVKNSNGKNLLRFESSQNVKEKNKYSKFLINVNDLGDATLAALKDKKPLSFKEIDFEKKSTINLENLKDFLCLARQNTYAGGSSGVDNPRLLESTQMEFQKASYFYRDICFTGNKKFIGQEIIYQNEKPVWGMNYTGTVLGKIETNFLKEALLKLSEKCRLGQNCEYEKRENKYKDVGTGTLENFAGQEELFINNKSIYKFEYHGGLI